MRSDVPGQAIVDAALGYRVELGLGKPVEIQLNATNLFNKRYIWAVTLGCAIANLTSPLGVVDVIFGSLGTLVMTSLSYYLTRNVESVPKKLAICVAICALMSWSVALELYFVSKAPFWMTYLTVGIGELISMAIGAIIVYRVSKVVDLSE